MTYSKILVPLDDTVFSRHALSHVVEIAQSGTHIHLLSVVAEPDPVEMAFAYTTGQISPSSSVWLDKVPVSDPFEIYLREKYLIEIAAWLTNLGYVVSSEVLPGNVSDAIVCTAQRGFDLIVMASHIRTGLKKLAYGSIAESVFHQSPCPVLIIPVRDS